MPRLSLPPDAAGTVVPVVRRSFLEARRSGAWKVAYADFVTALMALFIVLWMMNASGKVKQSVQGYFRDPRAYSRALNSGVADPPVNQPPSVDEIQRRIEEALRAMPDFQAIRKNIVFSITAEGLRIDLLENEQGMFFVTGSPAPTSAGERLLAVLGGQLSRMPNSLVIEGHTDAQPFRDGAPTSRYGNWELATDRANSARRLLHSAGVRADQVVEVRGYADRRLLNAANPKDPKNRRVSLVVRFSQ